MIRMTSLTNIWHEFAFRSCHMTSMNTVFCFKVHGSCHGWNAPDCTWYYSNFCSVLSVDNFWPSLMVLVPHAVPWTLFTNKPRSQQTCLASNLSTGTQAMVPLIIFPAKISVHTSKMGVSVLLWPVHHAHSCKRFYSLSKTPSRFFAS